MTNENTRPEEAAPLALLDEYRRVVIATQEHTHAIGALADSVDEVAAEVRTLAERRTVADACRAVLGTKAGAVVAICAALGVLIAFLRLLGLTPEVIGAIVRAAFKIV